MSEPPTESNPSHAKSVTKPLRNAETQTNIIELLTSSKEITSVLPAIVASRSGMDSTVTFQWFISTSVPSNAPSACALMDLTQGQSHAPIFAGCASSKSPTGEGMCLVCIMPRVPASVSHPYSIPLLTLLICRWPHNRPHTSHRDRFTSVIGRFWSRLSSGPT